MADSNFMRGMKTHHDLLAIFLLIGMIVNTSLGWIAFLIYLLNDNYFHISNIETEGWIGIVAISGMVSLVLSPIWSATWLNRINISIERKTMFYWLNAFPSILFQSTLSVVSLSSIFMGMLYFSQSWIVMLLSCLPPLFFFLMNWLCYRKISKKYRMMSLVFLSIAFYPCGYVVHSVLWHIK